MDKRIIEARYKPLEEEVYTDISAVFPSLYGKYHSDPPDICKVELQIENDKEDFRLYSFDLMYGYRVKEKLDEKKPVTIRTTKLDEDDKLVTNLQICEGDDLWFQQELNIAGIVFSSINLTNFKKGSIFIGIILDNDLRQQCIYTGTIRHLNKDKFAICDGCVIPIKR